MNSYFNNKVAINVEHVLVNKFPVAQRKLIKGRLVVLIRLIHAAIAFVTPRYIATPAVC